MVNCYWRAQYSYISKYHIIDCLLITKTKDIFMINKFSRCHSTKGLNLASPMQQMTLALGMVIQQEMCDITYVIYLSKIFNLHQNLRNQYENPDC